MKLIFSYAACIFLGIYFPPSLYRCKIIYEYEAARHVLTRGAVGERDAEKPGPVVKLNGGDTLLTTGFLQGGRHEGLSLDENLNAFFSSVFLREVGSLPLTHTRQGLAHALGSREAII